MMSEQHVQVSDHDTDILRYMFRVLLNTSESFGPACSHSSQAGAYTLPTNTHTLTASSSVSAVTHPLPINVQTLTAIGHPLSDPTSNVHPAMLNMTSDEAMQESVSSQVEAASKTSYVGHISQRASCQYSGDGMELLGTSCTLPSNGKQHEFCKISGCFVFI